MRRRSSGNTTVVGRDELLKRLEEGEIFRPGSWSRESLRHAAYDVRMADDLMVIPDPFSVSAGKFYSRGDVRRKEVILRPGDVAFLSSAEKMCIPWDLSALIGAKFGLTSKGLLLLTGTLLDPGYGLRETRSGQWEAEEDQRLHFLLANVGSSEVVLHPGQERVAALQFMKVPESSEKRYTRSVGYDTIADEYLREGEEGVGLVFFRQMADLQGVMREAVDRIDKFDTQISGFRERIGSVESASNQIVMFGLYLLCFTLLGLVLAGLVAIVEDGGLVDRLNRIEGLLRDAWRSLLLMLVSVIALSAIMMLLVRRLIRPLLRIVVNFAAERRRRRRANDR